MKTLTFILFLITFVIASYFLLFAKDLCHGVYWSMLAIINLMSLYKQIEL